MGECFEEFIKDYLKPHAELADMSDSVAFVGSVAFAFQEILLQVLEPHNIKCSKILKNPMDGLIDYYGNL